MRLMFATTLCCIIIVSVSMAQEAAIVTKPPQAASKVLCKIDEDQPEYMPNIYWCESNERCCENEGLPSCCGTSITTDAV